MKNRVIALMVLCFAFFTIIPLTASAANNVQITGQGQLVITANFIGSTAEVYITNSQGKEVYDRIFSSYGGNGTVNAVVPNLPYDTYKIIIGGQALTLSNLHYNFQ
ncbi:hypothetical protein [Paenibacillus pini]|uniref:Uncharacterized protein n=1 Tax=Paenibacillus pini JCM 16418 TaxID=1236976 RepID=W7Z4U5_9BACL|nr:hypothetical protein [Paenibacillus pini]GAF09364.1 hypothetical protein JCM16418_3503 [Paenibacillus pini JCM 16418]